MGLLTTLFLFFRLILSFLWLKNSSEIKKSLRVNYFFQIFGSLGFIGFTYMANFLDVYVAAMIIVSEVILAFSLYCFAQLFIQRIGASVESKNNSIISQNFPGLVVLYKDGQGEILAGDPKSPYFSALMGNSTIRMIVNSSNENLVEVDLRKTLKVDGQNWLYCIESVSSSYGAYLIYFIQVNVSSFSADSGKGEFVESDIITSDVNFFGGLVSGITHELSNIITIISARTYQGKMLIQKPEAFTKESVVPIFESILKESDRCKSLIQNFKRYGDAKVDESFSEYNIGDLITSMRPFFETRLRNNSVALQIDQTVCDKNIRVHRGSFELSFYDILFRFMKAVSSRHEGSIRVSYEEDDSLQAIAFSMVEDGIATQDVELVQLILKSISQVTFEALEKDGLKLKVVSKWPGVYLYLVLPKRIVTQKSA